MGSLGTPPFDMWMCRTEPVISFLASGPQPITDVRGPGTEPRPGESGTHKRFSGLLNIVVERELVRVRAQSDGVGFAPAFIADEGFEQLLAEDVALEQECVILLQAVECFLERG